MHFPQIARREQMQNHIPRLLLSATGSDSGKTTMMLALLSAFQKSGVVVQSYKSGPDYIDPMFVQGILAALLLSLGLNCVLETN